MKKSNGEMARRCVSLLSSQGGEVTFATWLHHRKERWRRPVSLQRSHNTNNTTNNVHIGAILITPYFLSAFAKVSMLHAASAALVSSRDLLRFMAVYEKQGYALTVDDVCSECFVHI
jgi:hypothetical protein